jgi:serine/threonine protein kinase
MVDWWSLGVLMVEILQGRSPFTRVTEEEEDHSIVHDRILYDPPDISSNFDETTKDLILKLLEKDPSKRIGFENDAEDLKKHPFFETIDWDKIKNKLCPPPKKPILCHKYDVSEFCTEFTDELPENFDLPEEIPKAKNIDKIFRGFSYFPSDEKPVIEDLYNLQSLVSFMQLIILFNLSLNSFQIVFTILFEV